MKTYHYLICLLHWTPDKLSPTYQKHHKKLKGLLLIAIVLFLYTKPTSADDILSRDDQTVIQTAEQLQSSVVKITIDSTGEASGFFITDHEVITNQHVTTGSSFIMLTQYDGHTCYGEIEYADKVDDLALIHAYCQGTPLKLAQSVKVGQSVLIMSNPLGMDFFLSKGIISSLSSSKYLLHSAFTDHGSSGSPVVNLQGELVGVTKGKTDMINAAINLKTLSDFMRRALR